MINPIQIISILFLLTSFELQAVDLASIEAEEREKIISELSWRIEAKQNCDVTLNWDDSGSGADKDGYFFLPNVSKEEYIIGGYVSEKLKSNHHCVITVREVADNPQSTPQLLSPPSRWELVWKDTGSGANKDGSIWQAIPVDKNYECLGEVSVIGYKQPNIPAYRCVHTSLIRSVEIKTIYWSDTGSGAEKPVTLFRLPNTISFRAVPKRVNKLLAFDLSKNASSSPSDAEVDKILAERMAPLKADIEAKARQQIEDAKIQAEKKRIDEENKKIEEARKQEAIKSLQTQKTEIEQKDEPVTKKEIISSEKVIPSEEVEINSHDEIETDNAETSLLQDTNEPAPTSNDEEVDSELTESNGLNSIIGKLVKNVLIALAIFIGLILIYKPVSKSRKVD